MNSIPVLMLKQLPQLLVVKGFLIPFRESSLASWGLGGNASLLGNGSSAQAETHPGGKLKYSGIWGNGRGRKMVAGLSPLLGPTDLPGPILSTMLCWSRPGAARVASGWERVFLLSPPWCSCIKILSLQMHSLPWSGKCLGTLPWGILCPLPEH